MSAAEIRAREVYNEYNLGMLPDDVQRELIILFLSSNRQEDIQTDMPTISVDELRQRAIKSYEQALNRESKPIDNLLDNLSKQYPWL